jgi:4'-phosphopantetheinyl transferase
MALVAVCRGGEPVGVDLERRRALREPERLAARICSRRELASVDGGRDHAGLLRLWVRKEAVAKATGQGLSQVLNGIDVLDGPVAGGWRVLDLSAAPGYLGAVAFPATVGGFTQRAFASDFG